MESPPATEQSVIASLRRAFGAGDADPRVLVGNGDDCAVLRLEHGPQEPLRPGRPDLHFTTDLLVEGVHFDLRLASLADVGYKALAVNLSDLASMGAVPAWVLGNLGLPPGAAQAQVEELLGGVASALDAAQAAGGPRPGLLGGDTVAAPQWLLGFTLIGTSEQAPLLRSGARPGDLIWHSGSLGLAQTGLHALLAGLAGLPALAAGQYPLACAAQRRPQPQLALGAWLAREGLASACIDLSDSLSQCLLQLAQASGVGLDLDLRDYQLHPEVDAFVAAHTAQPARDPAPAAADAQASGSIDLPAPLDPRAAGLHFASAAEYLLASAEDYQLLFCAPPHSTARLLHDSPVPLTCIGTVLDASAGCRYRVGGGSFALTARGWEHR